MKYRLILTILLCSNLLFAQDQLYIGPGATLHAEAGSVIQVNTLDFVNAGTAQINGTLNISSTSAQSLSNTSASNANINQLSLMTGSFNLSGNFDIASSLFFFNGADLALNSNAYITLASTAQITGEDEDHVISGEDGATIFTERTATTSNSFGNIGFVLNSADANLGLTKVYRFYETDEINGNDVVLRRYRIEPANNTGLNANASFDYAPVDLNGLSETVLSLFRSADGSTDWQERGGTVNQTDNDVTLGGIDAFSTWVLTTAGAILPVKLVYFDAEAMENNSVLCTWQTASESNNSHFEVERSQNGLEFEYVGEVVGAGTVTTPRDYDLEDEQPFSGHSYYRLKQVDFDGEFEYSEVRQVYIDRSSGIVLFPNPAVEQISVAIPNDFMFDAYRVIDVNGRILKQGAGNVQLQINVSDLEKGVYFLELSERGNVVKQIQFIKQ